MAGEINGTNVVISNGTGVIVGQMEATLTYNGTPIDISNKSNGDNVTLLDGQLAGKQLQWAGTIVYNTDAQAQKVLTDSLTGIMDTYTIAYPAGGTTDESFSALMMPNGRADTLPHGDKMSSSITFLSSGAITHVPYAA
tara:strand:- start:60 stop:476 length:417 start_codon:yes stop_codon:yes gene_type:complete